MAGPWEKYGAGTRGIPIGPQDPTMDLKRPAAQTNIQAQQSDMANDVVTRERGRQQIAQEAELFAARKQAADSDAAMKALQLEAARKDLEAKNPLNPQQIASAESDAMSKLKTIDRIRQNYNDSWLPAVGTGAETVKDWFGSSGASDVAADVESLKAGGALSEILKMTQATGRNPFTPMSNADVEIIARNTGNLTQRQSPKSFFANLGNYSDAYKKAYAGAVGQRTLNQEIERLLPTIPPAKREQFRADALRRYNERMSRPGGLLGSSRRGANTPRKPSVIDFNDWND